MHRKRTDTLEIAIALDEAHPEVDRRYVNFVDLREWVLKSDEFDDAPERSGEPILEAIQVTWVEEREQAQRRADCLAPGVAVDHCKPAA